MVERLRHMTHVWEGPGRNPNNVDNFFSICSMDNMINSPKTCLALNRLQKSLVVKRKTSALVKCLEYTTPVREGSGSKPLRVKLYTIYSMDFMIIPPMACLTLKGTVYIWWSDVKQQIKKHSHNPFPREKCIGEIEPCVESVTQKQFGALLSMVQHRGSHHRASRSAAEAHHKRLLNGHTGTILTTSPCVRS